MHTDFRKRGREGERGEKQQCERETLAASHTYFNGGLNLQWGAMCPDQELNPGPFGLRDNTQYPEPHQPGHYLSWTLSSVTPTQKAGPRLMWQSTRAGAHGEGRRPFRKKPLLRDFAESWTPSFFAPSCWSPGEGQVPCSSLSGILGCSHPPCRSTSLCEGLWLGAVRSPLRPEYHHSLHNLSRLLQNQNERKYYCLNQCATAFHKQRVSLTNASSAWGHSDRLTGPRPDVCGFFVASGTQSWSAFSRPSNS